MSYGLDERVEFTVKMVKNLNGWAAVATFKEPVRITDMEPFQCGVLGANLSFQEALTELSDMIQSNLRVAIQRAEWPRFVVNPGDKVPLDIDRSQVMEKFPNA